MGCTVQDTLLACAFLSGLPEELESYWLQIILAADREKRKITFEEVIRGVVAKDQRTNYESNLAKAIRVGNFGKQPKGKGKGKDSDSSAKPSLKDRDSSRNN